MLRIGMLTSGGGLSGTECSNARVVKGLFAHVKT